MAAVTEEGRPPLRVVAVVVTYNRLGLLRRLVARLGEIERVDDVVVVDNASTDGTAEWLAASGSTVGGRGVTGQPRGGRRPEGRGVPSGMSHERHLEQPQLTLRGTTRDTSRGS